MCDANKKILETWEDSQEKSFSNIEIPRKKFFNLSFLRIKLIKFVVFPAVAISGMSQP